MALKKRIPIFLISSMVIVFGGCDNQNENVGTFFKHFTALYAIETDKKADELKKYAGNEFINHLYLYGVELLKEGVKRYADDKMKVKKKTETKCEDKKTENSECKDDKNLKQASTDKKHSKAHRSAFGELEAKRKEHKNARREKEAEEFSSLYTQNLGNCIDKLYNIYCNILNTIYPHGSVCFNVADIKNKIPQDLDQYVTDVIEKAIKKCKEEKTYLRFTAYVAGHILAVISTLHFIIKSQENNAEKAELVKDCKKKIIQCCSLFNSKINEAIKKISGIDVDLYELSKQNMQHNSLDFCRIPNCLKKEDLGDGYSEHDHIISIPIGTFNIMFVVFLLDGKTIKEMPSSECFTKADTYSEVFSKNKKASETASLYYMYSDDSMNVVYFEKDIACLQVITEILIDNCYYKLLKCVTPESLHNKDKFSNKIKNSQYVDINKLRKYYDVISDIAFRHVDDYSNQQKTIKFTIKEEFAKAFNQEDIEILFSKKFCKELTPLMSKFVGADENLNEDSLLK